MAVTGAGEGIIVRKKEGDKTSLHRFTSIEDLVKKINQYDPDTHAYGFVPSNCDLSGLDFSGAEFKCNEIDEYTGDCAKYDFSGSDLSGCKFNQCEGMAYTNFTNTTLDDCQLKSCTFETNSLNGAKGKNTDFSDSGFNECDLEGCVFENSNFTNVSFWKSQMNDSKFLDNNFKISSNSGHCGMRRCDVSGSEINEVAYDFAYMPNLKMDNLKGSPENIKCLQDEVAGATKEFAKEQRKRKADLQNPQYLERLNMLKSMGLDIGKFGKEL